MDHCCCSEPAASARPSQRCPHDQSQGKPVKLITLNNHLVTLRE